MSHREAESMLNYSSESVFMYILGTIASCSPRETWNSLPMSYSKLSPKARVATASGSKEIISSCKQAFYKFSHTLDKEKKCLEKPQKRQKPQPNLYSRQRLMKAEMSN